MWKLLVLAVVAVTVTAVHRCWSDTDCAMNGCPTHPGQHSMCVLSHHHGMNGTCHCKYPFHACTRDNGCAGFMCPDNTTTRCTLINHHHPQAHPQHCICN